MSELLTTSQLEKFLKDVELSSTTDILEEGKEKDELIKIAKARGYSPGKSKDLAFFKNTYAFATIANKNRMRLNKKALLKALPTMIGKPVNIDHQRNYVVGHLIDYRYIQKEDKVISYGVIYRANFPDVWENMKRLFKSKKLTTSYEIWSPKDKRKIHPDGTEELLQQEIAGDAILFRTKPAFEDAKMLAIAKETLEKVNENLVYASDDKYKGKEKEIITSQEAVEQTIEKEEVLSQPRLKKTKCSNCGEELEINPMNQLPRTKCSKCFAILDNTGKMIYPPQIKNFKMLCPSCNVNDWLILATLDDKVKVRCQSCAKEYEFYFSKKDDKILQEKFQTLYMGAKSCLQCGASVSYAGVSTVKKKILTCKKCGLAFAIDTSNPDRYKRIAKIKEIVAKSLIKSSKEGGNKMGSEITLTKFHRFVATDNFEDVVKASIEDEYDESFDNLENAKRLTYQERQNLSDSDFAVVIRVKNKTTGKMRKIRKYPIYDKAHVRNALTRLEQQKVIEDLKKLGVSVEAVKSQVAKKAKQLGTGVAKVVKKDVKVPTIESNDKLKKYIDGIKRLANLVKSLRKEIVLEKSNVKFYQDNSLEIAKRREDLGDYAKDLSDKEILEDKKFEKVKSVKLEKEETSNANVVDNRAEQGTDVATEMGRKLRQKSVYNIDNLKK